MNLASTSTPLGSGANRWVRIGLRSAHILGFSIYVGGAWYGLSDAVLTAPLLWSFVTGGALAAVNLWSSGLWLVEVRGVITLGKLILLAGAVHLPTLRTPLLVIIVLLASVGSHMPGRYRYYSLWHRRRTH